jgi:tripartite-type tricarboxylate transporter receptor subunit TctC
MLLFAAGTAAAQTYPARPVRIVVPSSIGGGTDIVARVIAHKLSEAMGQQFVVENRPGASTMIGGEVVARAAPDGYTLLMGISTLAINPAMFRKVPYDAQRDFVPITQAVFLPNILIVHPSLPVRTVKELIAFAKARPGALNFASAGTGTNPHLSMELFRVMARLDIVHIAYKGSAPGVTDLLSGHVSLMTPNILTAMPHVRSGRLRALGVTSARRASGAPDIPTMAQAGLPGYEAVQWYGLLAPRGTSASIASGLNAAATRSLRLPEVRQRLAGDGAEVVASTPEEFGAFIRAETAKWAKVVKDAGIAPD